MNRAFKILVSAACILGVNTAISQQSDPATQSTPVANIAPAWEEIKSQDGIIVRYQTCEINGQQYLAFNLENTNTLIANLSWVVVDELGNTQLISKIHAVNAGQKLFATSPSDADGELMLAIVSGKTINNYSFNLSSK